LGAGACKNSKAIAKAKTNEPSDSKKEVIFGSLYVGACAERSKGNLQEALKLFSECLKTDSSSAPAHYEIASIQKMLGNNEAALPPARFAAEADPKNEWYQLLYIDCLNGLRQFSKALKVREQLSKNFPTKSEFKEDLAIQYAVMGQYEKSFHIYEELEKNYGTNEQLTLNKVKLLKSQHKFKEAEVELKKLSASSPNEPRYYAYLAEHYLEQNDLSKAKDMYDRILILDPSNIDIHLALHDFYAKQGKDAEAYEHLKLAMKHPDLDLETKTSIVSSYYRQSESGSELVKRQGLELATIFIQINPNATQANALYADFLRLDKKYKEAASYYYKAAKEEKRDFRVWDNLLFIDNELNLFDSLEHHSATAIELFPNQPINYIYNGVANTQLKNYTKAIQSLRSGVDYVVDNKALLIQFYSALGDAYYYLKDYPNSDLSFEKALKEDSDNTYVLNNYAYYLSVRNQDLEKAERFSKRSNDLQPNNKNYMDTYGWILFQQKKYSTAEEWLKNASKMGAKNATILEHYGDVLFMLGKKEEALQQWEAAKIAGGNSEALLKKIKDKKIDVN
jgi:tetratricopeptide (TPR) repeat protein